LNPLLILAAAALALAGFAYWKNIHPSRSLVILALVPVLL
jgi:hypothetical protein